jgi:outer membrane immunogenic protein
MRIIIAAAVLAAASATPAFAQDATAPANFSGGHIEAISGYDSVHAVGDSTGGVLYGIAGGYDFRSGGAVFGIEAEASESTTGQCAGTDCFEASRDLYVGGRLGAVVRDNVLLYAKAGYTNARFDITTAGLTDSGNLDGIRGGAGVELALRNSPVSVRAEYRYSNYEGGLSRNQGVIGVGIRF